MRPMPKNCNPSLGAAVLLPAVRNADELHVGTERLVDLAGPEGAGIDRTADEFPEGIEVGEAGALGAVPLHEHRHLGARATLVGVEQVVGEVAAEVVHRLCHLLLGWRHDVLPQRAVLQRDLGGDGAVGVDLVTRVDEEVGIEAAHALVDPVAAEGFVDAPTLAGFVTGKREDHVARPIRRRPKAPHQGNAERTRVGQTLELHTVQASLSGR